MSKIKAVTFLLLILSFNANRAVAGCDPKEDPCAPKKVKNEWVSSLAVGLGGTNGNSKTGALTTLADFTKETDEDIITLNVVQGYAEDRNGLVEDSTSTTGFKREKIKTRNDITGQAGYKLLLDELNFINFGTRAVHDELADIDYRVNLYPTFGHFFIKNDDYKLSFDVGPGYTFERVGSLDNNYFSPRLGEEFGWIISCNSKITQNAEVFFNTDDTEDYQINTNLNLETVVSSLLSVVVGIRDTYDNLPAANRQKNDLSLISALKFTF